MASKGYMGPDQVKALIGQWLDVNPVVGQGGEEGERGERDRWWRKRPSWFQGSSKDWDRLPEQYQLQVWQQGIRAGYGQQPQVNVVVPQYGGQYPGYPYPYPQPQPQPPVYPYPQQQPYYPYGGQQQPQVPGWWWQQPSWWRQANPYYPGLQPPPWVLQGQQPPPYPPPPGPPPDDRVPTDPSGNYVWVRDASGGGHWERRRANTPAGPSAPSAPGVPPPSVGPRPVVREHRAGMPGSTPGGGVSVTPGQPRGIQNLSGPGLSSLFFGQGTISGQWMDMAPMPLGQGPVLVDAPAPTRANRDILPMSTGVPILPTQSAQITGRPQTVVFSINRFLISNAGTAGGAADWIVNDIKIGNRSQFVQSGDVPGDLFAVNAIDTFVRFDTAQTAMDVVVVVTYIGLNECGAPFFGAMVGTAAV